jgi:glycosyltransferase involved in cell wall biosynthesis
MKVCFYLAGLPGDSYHGGAVTCWAILKQLLKEGHEVEILSLYDISKNNPYINYRDKQFQEISKLGVPINFIEYDSINLFKQQYKENKTLQKIKLFCNLYKRIEYILPYVKLTNKVEDFFKDNSYDKLFCYHYEPLATLYYFKNIKKIKIIAGLGDLLFEPRYYRVKYLYKTNNIYKNIRLLASFYFLKFIQVNVMIKLINKAEVVGCFAAHYSNWFNLKSIKKVHYFRTPTHDPIGDNWKNMKNILKNKKFIILHIGELNTTAASIGIREFVVDTIPLIEKLLPEKSFEVHFVGGGEIEESLITYFNKPYIKQLGRIYPPDNEFLKADVLVVPIPIKLGIRVRIITAFSFGTCVIAHEANKSGIPELDHKKNCLLVKSSDEMAKSISEIFNDKNLKISIENNAKSLFLQNFSEDVAAHNIIKTF